MKYTMELELNRARFPICEVVIAYLDLTIKWPRSLVLYCILSQSDHTIYHWGITPA
jgi:hypothetical protein